MMPFSSSPWSAKMLLPSRFCASLTCTWTLIGAIIIVFLCFCFCISPFIFAHRWVLVESLFDAEHILHCIGRLRQDLNLFGGWVGWPSVDSNAVVLLCAPHFLIRYPTGWLPLQTSQAYLPTPPFSCSLLILECFWPGTLQDWCSID